MCSTEDVADVGVTVVGEIGVCTGVDAADAFDVAKSMGAVGKATLRPDKSR